MSLTLDRFEHTGCRSASRVPRWKRLVVVSDGRDVGSKHGLAEIRDKAIEGRIQVNVLLMDPPSLLGALLGDLAIPTAGMSLTTRTQGDLEHAIRSLETAHRGTYLIGTPAEPARRESYLSSERHFEVAIRRPAADLVVHQSALLR